MPPRGRGIAVTADGRVVARELRCSPGQHRPMDTTEEPQRQRVIGGVAFMRLEERPGRSTGLDVVGQAPFERAVERRADLLEPDRLQAKPLGECGAIGLRHAHMNAPPSAM